MVYCVSDFRFTQGEWRKLIEELRVRGVTQEVRLRGLNRTRDRTRVTIRTNIQKHCICRRPESGVMPHGTALQHWTITSYRTYSVIQTSVHAYMHWSNCSLDKTDYSCKPYDLRKRPKLTLSLSQLSLHSILLSSFVLFMFLYCLTFCVNVIHSNYYKNL